MNRGRSPLKYRPKPETFNELLQSGVRTGRTGHNDSLSKLEGDLSMKKKAVESQDARKDESQRRRSPSRIRRQSESPKKHVIPTAERRLSLQGTNSQKNHAPVLSRTNSERNRAPTLSRTNSQRNRAPGLSRSNSGQFNTNDDDSKSKEEDGLAEVKKVATRNFMKHTRSFNAKSQKPVDLKDERVRKKAEHDSGGIKQKSEGFCAKTCRNPYCSLNHNKPTPEKTFSYLKSRSPTPSIDSQISPRNLKYKNSIEKRNSNLSGLTKQNRLDTKRREKEEIEVCERVIEEIKHENEELKFENLFEGNEQEDLLEVGENENDINKIFEGQESLLEFEKNEINMKDESQIFEKDNVEKHEVINENISENNDDEVLYPLETVTENLKNGRAIDENLPEVETNEADELETIYKDENSFVLETIHEDENLENYEVIDTKYDEISDLYVLSSCNDEIDSSLQEISIEDELSKLIGTEDSKLIDFESTAIELITKENQDIIGNNNFAPVNPKIEDIVTNKPEKMEEVSTGEDEEKEEEIATKKGSKKWLVDYALRKLIKKLETSEKLNDINKVAVLIEAYENVIPLAIAMTQVSGY